MKRALLRAAPLAVLLAGCAGGVPDRRVDSLPVPPAYLADYRPPPGEAELWWRGFRSAELDALVARALAANPDIAAARFRLAAAEALVRAERSDLLPGVDGFGTVDSATGQGARDGLRVEGGLSARFTPDLSGRLGREVEVALAQRRASAFLVADARRLIAAAVATRWVALKRSEARLALLGESTDLQRQTLRIVRLRFEAGLSANLDVRRAAADLGRTEAQRGLLELERVRAARALDALVGRPPTPLPPVPEAPAVPDYAGGPPPGVPADLVRRRPDLLVAEARLAEAAAQLGVEQADLYPSLVLPGQISLGSGGGLGGVIATIAGLIDIPLFDGGRRRAEVAAAREEANARFEAYRGVLLDAIAEAETALAAGASFNSRIAELEGAIAESEAAFTQSNALYREGLASLFDVLDAQRQLIGSREALIDSQASLAEAIIALYAATGVPAR